MLVCWSITFGYNSWSYSENISKISLYELQRTGCFHDHYTHIIIPVYILRHKEPSVGNNYTYLFLYVDWFLLFIKITDKRNKCSTKVSHSIAQQASLMIPANKGSLDLKVSFQPLTVFALVSAPFLQLLYSFSQLKLTATLTPYSRSLFKNSSSNNQPKVQAKLVCKTKKRDGRYS